MNQKIMKYFVYLNNKDNDSIVKQSFLMSKNLHSMNNSGYFSNFINMFEQYNLTSLDAESLDNDKIRRYTTGKTRIRSVEGILALFLLYFDFWTILVHGSFDDSSH